jgi:hypothetical protein
MLSLLLASLCSATPSHLSSPPACSVADELKRDRLPADVDLVMHLDIEGFKATQLWRHIASKGDAQDNDHGLHFDELDDVRERFGIDPFEDVRALTMFKTKSEEEPTVVLFSTTEKIDAALSKFKAEKGYARVVEDGIELHTWKEDEGDGAFAYLHTGRGSERVVVLASSAASAVRAARVLRGQDPSHAVGGSPLLITPAPGSFLYVAAAEVPHLHDFAPASQVFGLAQGIQVDFGEAGGFLRGHVGLATKSPQDAFDVSNVLNGLISMARLAAGEIEEELGDALELLTGLQIRTRGTEVTMDFEFGVERLLEIIEDLAGDAGQALPRKKHR